MYDPDNRSQERRQQSLLSLGRGGEKDRDTARSGSLLSSTTPTGPDAAERHRLARARREAAPNPLLSALAESAPDQSVPTPVPDKKPASRWNLSRLVPERQPQAPLAPISNIVERPRASERGYESAYAGAAADDYQSDHRAPDDNDGNQQWKPLIDPMKVIMGVVRSKKLIAATTLAGALIGIALAVSTPKKYESVAELLVDPRDLKLTDNDLTQSGLASDATLAIVENQTRVLTSGTVLNAVVDRLKLENDPEFNGEGSGGIGSIVGGLRSLISGNGGSGGVDNRRALAVGNLARNLNVERGGKTFVIAITVKTKEPEKSALIANTMTDVFLSTYGKLQSDTAGRATDELTGRLDELRAGVEAAERKIEAFKAENDIIDAQGRLITDDEILKLNEQLSIARARTLELNAKAVSTRSIDVDTVLGGALPEQLSSTTMTELRSQYSTLKQEAGRLAVRLGPRHPERLALEAQLSGAREQLTDELRRIVSSVQVELKRAVQLEQELAARLAQLKVRQGGVSDDLVTLRELEREGAAKRAVYEAFLRRAKETGEQKDINTANMSVISRAYPPLDPTGPSRATISITGMMLGFMAGVGLGGARGAYDSLRDNASPTPPGRRQRRPRHQSALGKPQGDPGNRAGRLTTRETLAVAPEAPMSASEAASEPAHQSSGPLSRLLGGLGWSGSRKSPAAEKFVESVFVESVVESVGPSASQPDVAAPGTDAPSDEHAKASAIPVQETPSMTHPAFAPVMYAQPEPQAQPYQGYPQSHPGFAQPVYAQPQPVYAQPQPGYHQPMMVQPQPFHQPQYQPAMMHAPQPQAYQPWTPYTPMPQAYGYPQPIQQAAPIPVGYPAYAAPMAQPQQAYQPIPQAQLHYVQPGAYQPVAPEQPALRVVAPAQTPIEEIRDSLREFRETIRDLTESRARRRSY